MSILEIIPVLVLDMLLAGSSSLGYLQSCMLLGWPNDVYPNWSTMKIPQGVEISSWYSKRLTRASHLLGPLRELHYLMPRVLDGFYSLARDTKSVLFSLGTLSSCRESPVHLCIEKELPKFLILQVLDKRLPPLDNKVHKSIALRHFFLQRNWD